MLEPFDPLAGALQAAQRMSQPGKPVDVDAAVECTALSLLTMANVVVQLLMLARGAADAAAVQSAARKIREN